jgi:hypothetical protein
LENKLNEKSTKIAENHHHPLSKGPFFKCSDGVLPLSKYYCLRKIAEISKIIEKKSSLVYTCRAILKKILVYCLPTQNLRKIGTNEITT